MLKSLREVVRFVGQSHCTEVVGKREILTQRGVGGSRKNRVRRFRAGDGARHRYATCWHYFFFSSRRRHPICSRDWSSDVCSSDLFPPRWSGWDMCRPVEISQAHIPTRPSGRKRSSPPGSKKKTSQGKSYRQVSRQNSKRSPRSGERRGGEECRSRWGAYP